MRRRCSSSPACAAIRSLCSSRPTGRRSSAGNTFHWTTQSRDGGSIRCSRMWRGFVLRRAPLVRERSQGRRGRGHGALKPAVVQREVEAVRGLTAAAVRTRADVASFRFTQAVDLLLAVYARTHDSTYLAPARAVLDYLVDSGDAGLARSEEHTSELQSH